jgi:hypothetical protein
MGFDGRRRASQLIDTLLELMRSDDEAIRLAAVKGGFDRLLGRAPLSVDSTSTKIEHNPTALPDCRSGQPAAGPSRAGPCYSRARCANGAIDW